MSRADGVLDAIDRGFLRRFAERVQRRPRAEDDQPETAPHVPLATGDARDGGEAATPADSVPTVRPPFDPGPAASLAERLLQAAPHAWESIARQVEDAHRAGAAVIAVAGARRGEGRTTVVECLARTLVTRGHRVEVVERPPVDADSVGGAIVLVDAGVWFPGGPLRRAPLERASLGCHAAILVRRSGQPECAARGAAIEAVGLRLLGEVVTMVPATEAADAVT